VFERIIGNQAIKITLRRFIAARRVPHSFLLVGDDGIGKRQFALELAKSLLCRQPADGEACGVCPNCRRADAFAFPKPDDKDAHKKVILSEHPDLGTVIPYNRNILVDAIRDLEKEANFRPYEGSARVFIIDDADKMNDAATNALLKTLEEPSETIYLFLVSSRPDKLLPTIRSRCQVLRFAPVDTVEIERFLIDERAFSHNEARLAARLARGSVGRSVEMDIPRVKGLRERMLGVLKNSIDTYDKASLLKASEEMNDAKNKDSFEESLGSLESLVHDVWRISVANSDEGVTNLDVVDDLRLLAQKADRDQLASWIAFIEALRGNLIVNINKRVSTDALVVSMAA